VPAWSRAYWTNRIALAWGTDDVARECPGLTEEGLAVLERLLAKQDASVGVNCGVIRATAVSMFGKRALEGSDPGPEGAG
jgi:hypothetical protein